MSIHFMFDNHTFKTLSNDFPTAIEEALGLFDTRPNAKYGMVGIKDDNIKELDNLRGAHAGGVRDKFKADLEKLFQEYAKIMDGPHTIKCPHCSGKGTVMFSPPQPSETIEFNDDLDD